MHRSGVPLFTRTYDSGDGCCNPSSTPKAKVRDQSVLISGLLTSLNSLAYELGGGGIKHMELGRWHIYIDNSDHISSVILTDPDHEEHTKNKQVVSNISKLFTENFDVSKFMGNTSEFDCFEEKLLDSGVINENIKPKNLCKNCVGEFVNKITN